MSKKSKSVMLMGLLGAQLFKIMMRGCDICMR